MSGWFSPATCKFNTNSTLKEAYIDFNQYMSQRAGRVAHGLKH